MQIRNNTRIVSAEQFNSERVNRARQLPIVSLNTKIRSGLGV